MKPFSSNVSFHFSCSSCLLDTNYLCSSWFPSPLFVNEFFFLFDIHHCVNRLTSKFVSHINGYSHLGYLFSLNNLVFVFLKFCPVFFFVVEGSENAIGIDYGVREGDAEETNFITKYIVFKKRA